MTLHAPVLASLSGGVGRWLHHLHGPVVYLVVGLLVFAEAGFLLGFVVPGETAALIGGALAGLHNVNLVTMVVVVVVAAVVGDSVGYEVGKWIGPWLMRRRPLRDNPGVAKATDLVVRFGGAAVFFGRWIALARAMVPGVTGMSGMRYRTFLVFNALGAFAWGVTFVLIGFAVGNSYARIASTIGTTSLIVVAVAVVGVVTASRVHRRRRHRSEEQELVEPPHQPGKE